MSISWSDQVSDDMSYSRTVLCGNVHVNPSGFRPTQNLPSRSKVDSIKFFKLSTRFDSQKLWQIEWEIRFEIRFNKFMWNSIKKFDFSYTFIIKGSLYNAWKCFWIAFYGFTKDFFSESSGKMNWVDSESIHWGSHSIQFSIHFLNFG